MSAAPFGASRRSILGGRGVAKPGSRRSYFAATLEVIEAMTLDFILNPSLRFSMPWRRWSVEISVDGPHLPLVVLREAEAPMTGRLPSTTIPSDGRSPLASALRVPLFFSKSSAPRGQSFTAPGSASRTKLAAVM